MNRVYRWVLVSLSLLGLILLFFVFWGNYFRRSFINPSGLPGFKTATPVPLKPLERYAFKNLMTYIPVASQIHYANNLSQDPQYHTYLFTYQTEGKTMSGELNVPQIATPSGGFPTIVMLRGFVDPAIYKTGMGTKNAGAFFASHGFVTLAPDFFGYGQSDPPLADTIGERLQKPLNVIDLIASLSSLPFINPENLFIWAHSNGGQIALSVLEITGKSLPASLWAPVSKPFPYSILYYTDESEDQGKTLRRTLANFESLYDVFDYSIDRFYPQLKGPLQIHQGTNDDAVPFSWNAQLAQQLDQLGLKATLYTYPGADHNLRPSWDTAINRDLNFFKSYTKS